MKIFDVTLPVSSGLPVWPGDPEVVLARYGSIANGDGMNISRLACGVHTGTHVDAPLHYIENGSAVEQLPLYVLIGPAVVVDIPEAETITVNCLETAKLPSGVKRVLFKTSNSALWRNPRHEFNPDYVALTHEAAGWLVEKGIWLVGVDYLSVHLFSDHEPLTHQIFLQAGVVIVEGLNLQGISPGLYQLVCLPMKLAGSDGAPARVVLIQDQNRRVGLDSVRDINR